MGLEGKLRRIAAALAEEVIEPPFSACCGMAGDRGLLHPELPEAALGAMREELASRSPEGCMCSNRTCEIGLTRATGQSFASFPLLLEQLTRPPATAA
jgi:D-lactate dehydrogenase